MQTMLITDYHSVNFYMHLTKNESIYREFGIRLIKIL